MASWSLVGVAAACSGGAVLPMLRTLLSGLFSRVLDVPLRVAVLFHPAATVGFEPGRRQLELLAPHETLAKHLSGYEVRSRFGQTLESGLNPAVRLGETRRQAQELAASCSRIVQAQDAERHRIERNIHDGVQQEIVALAAKAQLARNQLRRAPDLADATLSELRDDIRHALQSLRELARGIHPAVLTDKGLLEAVQAQASRMPLDVTVEAAAELRDRRFAAEVEAGAYFFVSEALANALKHASPTRVLTRLKLSGRSLSVEVADDGEGFVPSEADGTGLRGVRDRIESVGGALHVTSAPGEGTRLHAVFPATRAEPRVAP